MKKFISIFVVVLAALFATSCELDSGTEAQPNRANQLLWQRAYNALDEQYQHILVVTELNDTMRDTEYGAKPYIFTGSEISEEEGVYTITYGDDRTYCITTSGKKLEEGGEWVIQVKYGSYMEFVKLGTVQGVVGEPMKFFIFTDNTLGYRSQYRNATKSEIDYSFNAKDLCIDVTFTNVEGFSVDVNSSAVTDYIVEYKSVEPMIFCDGLLDSGKMEVVYKDNILHTERGVVVEIINKLVTFAPHK